MKSNMDGNCQNSVYVKVSCMNQRHLGNLYEMYQLHGNMF